MKSISNEEYMQKRMVLPLRTNTLDVNINMDAFFEKYAIVSYYTENEDKKNIAYEQFSECDFLSVTGIRKEWLPKCWFTKFFILVEKENVAQTEESLEKQDEIRYSIDFLDAYDNNTRSRIVASLAINSLGKKNDDRLMYSNGSLLVCDSTNFGANESLKELICLNIVVNEYLNLSARVQSFCKPKTIGAIYNAPTVFKISSGVNGNWWNGKTVKPVIVHGQKQSELDIEDYLIKGKLVKGTKNSVPYWPYKGEDYPHGKLFVIKQIVESVNKNFDGLMHLGFKSFNLDYYYESETSSDTESFIKDYLSGKIIYFEDNINTDSSKEHVDALKELMHTYMNNELKFSKKEKGSDMFMILCEPEKDKASNSLYKKNMKRMMFENFAIQHIVHSNNKREDKVSAAMARRIMLELIIKDCIAKHKMPLSLVETIQGWEYILFREKNKKAIGSTMSVDVEGNMKFYNFGFKNDKMPLDMSLFFKGILNTSDYCRVKGWGDYYVMRKDGNTYIIYDTEEIPMFDADKINDGYDDVLNNGVTVSMFKRKANVQEYFNGYVGLSAWLIDDLHGKKNGSYAYISGLNRNLTVQNGGSLEKMPHARCIHALKLQHPENKEQDYKEILDMLKFGFARWNELMTYPYAFKFLREYLDDQCEIAYDCHWHQINND